MAHSPCTVAAEESASSPPSPLVLESEPSSDSETSLPTQCGRCPAAATTFPVFGAKDARPSAASSPTARPAPPPAAATAAAAAAASAASRPSQRARRAAPRSTLRRKRITLAKAEDGRFDEFAAYLQSTLGGRKSAHDAQLAATHVQRYAAWAFARAGTAARRRSRPGSTRRGSRPGTALHRSVRTLSGAQRCSALAARMRRRRPLSTRRGATCCACPRPSPRASRSASRASRPSATTPFSSSAARSCRRPSTLRWSRAPSRASVTSWRRRRRWVPRESRARTTPLRWDTCLRCTMRTIRRTASRCLQASLSATASRRRRPLAPRLSSSAPPRSRSGPSGRAPCGLGCSVATRRSSRARPQRASRTR
eukprot:m.278484 g.278484  ORF g.278484 m.278484 type:complete len:367 (+) comp11101_c0_seq98:2107-3207(+)